MQEKGVDMTLDNFEALEERDALYYPYIHIRDVEWLKRTLLVFPHVVRMTPESYTPRDNPFVSQLCDMQTKRGPLLRSAQLFTPTVDRALNELQRNIETDLERQGKTFVTRYGKAAADAMKRNTYDPGFQLHPDKLQGGGFVEFLRRKQLAWNPEHPDDQQYLELHPQIGQAVLSTVAVACAMDEGLEIVTDPKDEDSRRLNMCLASRGSSELYNAWIHPGDSAPWAHRASPREILEVVAYHHCNTEKVTPERLVELADDREALARLMSALKKMAASIPQMMNEEKFRERLEGQAQDVLKRWKADHANMSNVSKEIFGTEGAKNVGDFMKKLAEKFMSPEVWAGTLTGTYTGLRTEPFLGVAI